MQTSWLVLIPPVLVVFLAILTRRIVFSLSVSIISAALILHDFQLKPALTTVCSRIWNATELGYLISWSSFWSAWYLFICLFLIVLGIIIVLINRTGGAFAYGRFIVSKLHSAKNAEIATVIMSHLFFVDDYFGSLTVGSVMQPITDQFKVPRVKLALLINAIAAPLAVLSPISSWSADIVMQLRQSGISTVAHEGTLFLADPFCVYLVSIAFLAYAYLMLTSIWLAVKTKIPYGVVAQHEQEAQRTGNLFGGKIPVAGSIKVADKEQIATSTVWDFLLPLATLFVAVFVGIIVLGFGRIPIALFIGSCCSLFVALIYFFIRKKLAISSLPSLVYEGAMLMLPSIMVLVLIWTLSALLKNDLQTGKYLASVLIDHMNIAVFPAMFFMLATLISATMGSAWGTIGLLIPIAVPMLTSFYSGFGMLTPDQALVLFPLVAAIVSGAVAGNHLSPIADIMVLSSASAGAYHFDLVKAQMAFAIPVIIASIISFLFSGFIIQQCGIFMTACTSLVVGNVVVVAIHILRLFCHNRSNIADK